MTLAGVVGAKGSWGPNEPTGCKQGVRTLPATIYGNPRRGGAPSVQRQQLCLHRADLKTKMRFTLPFVAWPDSVAYRPVSGQNVNPQEA